MFLSYLLDGDQCKYYTTKHMSVSEIKNLLLHESIKDDFYVTRNGKILNNSDIVENGNIRLVPRLVGGKGGFGSMLRAIGAQIEKTTNREACRDLSGRRLRDINEEKRLKNWIAQQAEREREAAERRKKKLERLCYQPKHDFSDQDYEKARSELTEKVHDAVEEGFRKAASSNPSGSKRKPLEQGPSQVKKKKTACLWVDADSDELSSSIDSSDSETEDKTTSKVNGAEVKTGTTANCNTPQLGVDGGEKSSIKHSDQLLDSKSDCEDIACQDENNYSSDANGTQSDSCSNISASNTLGELETKKEIEEDASVSSS